jgi:mycothiol S-conjugate amidase
MTKTILAVLAHPDDESFGIGGTLALYSRKGYDTYSICDTSGEEGSINEEHLNGYKDKAELRTNELKNAAKHLGLKEVFFLGYRDSVMPGTEANKHPDHIHIHQSTVLAFEKADDASFHPEAGSPFKPRALYYQVFPRGILRWTVRLMPLFGKDPTKFGLNGDVNLKELAEVEFPVHVRLDIHSVEEAKQLAGAQHASQGGGMRRGLMGFVARIFGGHEDYMRAYPPVGNRFRKKSDLFDI